MPDLNRITLIGNTPSPYTHKMLALLRYRHIPYSVLWANPTEVLEAKGIQPLKVALLPTFIFEDKGKPYAMVDSTPIVHKLETLFEGRSAIPCDPALAFVDAFLEDFADEWCTKYMFHYRWHPQTDADNAGTLLPFCMDPGMAAETQQWAKDFYSKRQIERLYVVGSNDTTAPIIDTSYRRLLAAMEAHLAAQPYLLGNRPSAGDFALYGQLTQLVGFDPTPRQITHEIAPRTVAWESLVGDLSGLEPHANDWLDLDSPNETLRDLLTEVGRGYVPAMLANAQALQAGQQQWQAEIDGALWEQQTFPYQGKCLQWLNEQYQALSQADQHKVNELFSGTGCEKIILT